MGFNPIEIEGLVQPIRRSEGCVQLHLWPSVVLAAVPAGFQPHPISTKRLRASASLNVKAHVAPIPFLFVSRRAKLVNRFLQERFALTVIAVDDILVVV